MLDTRRGAGNRTRTGTLKPARDFKSLVSTIPPHRQMYLYSSTEKRVRQEKEAPGEKPGTAMEEWEETGRSFSITAFFAWFIA